MQLKNIPLPPEVLAKLEAKYRENKTVVKTRRSTYNKANADLIRPILDAVYSDGQARTVPFSSLPLAPSTIYQKVVDGLRYLVDTEGGKYIEIRANYKIKTFSDCLVIMPRIRPIVVTEFNSNPKDITESKSWRDEVVEWVENPNIETGVKEVIQPKFSDEDKLWVGGLLSNLPQYEYLFIDEKTLRIMKEQIND